MAESETEQLHYMCKINCHYLALFLLIRAAVCQHVLADGCEQAVVCLLCPRAILRRPVRRHTEQAGLFLMGQTFLGSSIWAPRR